VRASYGTLGNDQIPNGYDLLAGEATYVFDGSLVNEKVLQQGQIAS
jgi:hypothetical protein